MSILDISNWTINEINNSINTFKDTSLTDIGMVNCDIESINIVGGITTATLWIDENIGIDGYTGTAPLKIYKEDKVKLRLSSPLLKGDTIEVVNGKLCHVHRWDKMVLDGSEDWVASSYILGRYNLAGNYACSDRIYPNCISDTIRPISVDDSDNGELGICTKSEGEYIMFNTTFIQIETFKQWLSENPIIVVYELASPYHEDITPLQSSIILKTFLESSMIINTNLPIETKLSYRTNVPSISTLSTRATELAESDNVIHNLMNIIDDEVDE